MDDVIKQRRWTKDELREAGFKHYPRKKVVIMARRLPKSEAPKSIQTDQGDTLIAKAGYMICYDAGDTVLPSLDDYYQWPVEPQIFAATYRQWDEELALTAPMEHLMAHGCQPYYKAVGVWAKELDEPALIQSLEHERPVQIQAGRYLSIGTQGEPYHMSDQSFHSRYDARLTEPPFKRALRKLVNFFKKDD